MFRLVRLATLSLLLAFAPPVAAGPALAAAKIIKLGTVAPEGSVWHDALLQVRQAWRDITGGAVELRIYPGGVLGGEEEMVRKLQRRSLDAVAITGAGLPRIDRSVEVLNVPLLFQSYAELDRVRGAIGPELEGHLAARNVKVLGWAEAGWVHFFARAPIRTPDELRALRLWTSPGASEAEALFQEFGFKVTPLPVTDMLTGLQTGLIDAIDVPPLFALLDRSYQFADHMLDLRWAPLNAATVISLDVWESLPEEHHEALLAAVQSVVAETRRKIRESGAQAVEEMRARGLTVIELDDATRAAWQAEAEAAWPVLRERSAHPELFDKVLELAAGYKAAHPDADPASSQ